jgi:alkylation response protein AidB-like acyl-CoA dehydrogenase
LRLCLFPRAAADVIDTWHVSGLRGTGSHDFAVTDLFVPEDNTVPPRDFTPVPTTQPGPIYAVPVSPIFSSILAVILLGIARSAIEALVALAASKTPMGSPSRSPCQEPSCLARAAQRAASKAQSMPRHERRRRHIRQRLPPRKKTLQSSEPLSSIAAHRRRLVEAL